MLPLISMLLISPNSVVKSVVFPNFSQGPFPKIAGKSPVNPLNYARTLSLPLFTSFELFSLLIYLCYDFQVVESVMKLGIKEDDIKIGSFTSTDLKDIINNSATSILTIVEHCIRTYTREKVLY